MIAINTTNIVLAAALLQFAVVAAIAFVKRVPKCLIASSLLLAVAYINAFGVRHESAALNAAAVTAPSGTGSCALIESGMSAGVVRAKLGQPQETRDDGKVRGPGAMTWIYRDSRCAVHLFDEKVELIE